MAEVIAGRSEKSCFQCSNPSRCKIFIYKNSVFIEWFGCISVLKKIPYSSPCVRTTIMARNCQKIEFFGQWCVCVWYDFQMNFSHNSTAFSYLHLYENQASFLSQNSYFIRSNNRLSAVYIRAYIVQLIIQILFNPRNDIITLPKRLHTKIYIKKHHRVRFNDSWFSSTIHSLDLNNLRDTGLVGYLTKNNTENDVSFILIEMRSTIFGVFLLSPPPLSFAQSWQPFL